MVSGSGSDLGHGLRIPWKDSLKFKVLKIRAVRNSQCREINKTYQNKIFKFQE